MKHEKVEMTEERDLQYDGGYYYYVCEKCGKRSQEWIDKRSVHKFYTCDGVKTSSDF